MDIRKTTLQDIPRMQEIFEDAKSKMRADGNMLQWTGGYPSDELLRGDIDRGVSYIVESDGEMVGTFAWIPGIDPTYLKIYEGEWLEDTSLYGTIHRIASVQGVHGVASVVFEWCWAQIPNIRVDTHRDNNIMQHILRKNGFSYCGIIYLLNGDERLAFQKIANL